MKHKKQPRDSKTADEKIQELTDDLKRVQAEFENYKKRTEKDSIRNCENAKAELMKKILPVVDTFESALKSGKTKEESKGLELVYVQLMKSLNDEGLTEISVKGRFNPDFHEAMLQQQSDDFGDEEIIDVIQKGYRMKEAIIRHAKVKINVREKIAEDKPESKQKNKPKDHLKYDSKDNADDVFSGDVSSEFESGEESGEK